MNSKQCNHVNISILALHSTIANVCEDVAHGNGTQNTLNSDSLLHQVRFEVRSTTASGTRRDSLVKQISHKHNQPLTRPSIHVGTRIERNVVTE